MFRRIQADHVALRAVWPDAPELADREMLLHSLRLALIQRIWLVASAIPDFSPRHGVTRAALDGRMLRLDVPAALELLAEVFPSAPDPLGRSRLRRAARPAGRRPPMRASMRKSFAPMARLFAQVREISTAVTHEVGALG